MARCKSASQLLYDMHTFEVTRLSPSPQQFLPSIFNAKLVQHYQNSPAVVSDTSDGNFGVYSVLYTPFTDSKYMLPAYNFTTQPARGFELDTFREQERRLSLWTTGVQRYMRTIGIFWRILDGDGGGRHIFHGLEASWSVMCGHCFFRRGWTSTCYVSQSCFWSPELGNCIFPVHVCAWNFGLAC